MLTVAEADSATGSRATSACGAQDHKPHGDQLLALGDLPSDYEDSVSRSQLTLQGIKVGDAKWQRLEQCIVVANQQGLYGWVLNAADASSGQ